jgi:hypothetical protein
MGQGVTCHQCGGSTPLPDDLRIPVFTCNFCRAELRTASYAGAAAVSADALLGHVRAVIGGATPVTSAAATAPRFQGGSPLTRAAECHHCRAPVDVPLDLRARELTCTRCGRTQPVNQYISDEERFALDMQRQVAGNEAFARLRAEGVPCGKCGAQNSVPDDGSIQLTCKFCRATILLSDYVDASAIARARLKHGVFAIRDEARRKQAERDKVVKKVVVIGVVFLFAISILVGILTSR